MLQSRSLLRCTGSTRKLAANIQVYRTCPRPVSARLHRRTTALRRPRAPYIPFVKHKPPHPFPPHQVSVLYSIQTNTKTEYTYTIHSIKFLFENSHRFIVFGKLDLSLNISKYKVMTFTWSTNPTIFSSFYVILFAVMNLLWALV